MERIDAQGEASGVAMLADTRWGAREQVEFLEVPGGPIISHLHLPTTEPVGVLLICSSICSDFIANYRQEVLTARALAGRGIAVQRFHYRGTGNSAGDPADTDFESMCEDARHALGHVVGTTGPVGGRIAILGTRVGALVAAAVAAERPHVPLALWEPTTRPRMFFREGFRAGMMHRLKEDGLHDTAGSGQTTEHLLATMRAQGWVDVLGYSVHRRLYESTADLLLVDQLGSQPRPLLLAQLAHEQELKPDYVKLVGELRTQGFDVDAAAFRTSGSWWFPGERLRTPDALRVATVDWVTARLEAVPS